MGGLLDAFLFGGEIGAPIAFLLPRLLEQCY
jgi:hypothetical protein